MDKTKVISFRLKLELVKLLEKKCEQENKKQSIVIRRAVVEELGR